MARIIVDSDELLGQVQLLDLTSAILEQCTDEDDLDVVEDCALDLDRISNNMRQIIREAEPVEVQT